MTISVRLRLIDRLHSTTALFFCCAGGGVRIASPPLLHGVYVNLWNTGMCEHVKLQVSEFGISLRMVTNTNTSTSSGVFLPAVEC